MRYILALVLVFWSTTAQADRFNDAMKGWTENKGSCNEARLSGDVVGIVGKRKYLVELTRAFGVVLQMKSGSLRVGGGAYNVCIKKKFRREEFVLRNGAEVVLMVVTESN